MLSANNQIAAALDLVAHLATDLNERKRQSEGRQRLLYWQSRIGQRFKSPLVQVSSPFPRLAKLLMPILQPHRALVKEGKMVLERSLKRASEHVESAGNGSTTLAQVHYLKAEIEPRPLIMLLTTDILILLHDNNETVGAVQLYSVLRLGQNNRTPCASAFGHEGKLRLVDARSILYLKLSSESEAHVWADLINRQVCSFLSVPKSNQAD